METSMAQATERASSVQGRVGRGRTGLLRRRGGFTLIELMVALVILAIVTAAIYDIYVMQYRHWISQDLRSEMLQRVRVALNDMTRDMQMAGFKPQISAIDTADSGQFTFEYQNNALPPQPAPFTTDRRYTYSFNTATNQVMKRVQSWNTSVPDPDKYTTNPSEVYLDDITNLSFTYYDAAGNAMATPVVAADLPNIRRIGVTITAQTSAIDPITKNRRTISETSQIYPRNLGISAGNLDQTCPATPAGLSVTDPNACGQLDLTWNANTEADLAGYRIYYGLVPGNYSGVTTVGKLTSTTLDGLSNNSQYYIALGSFDTYSNACALSSEVTAPGPGVPDTTPTPGTPQKTLQLDATSNATQVNLSWTRNSVTYPTSRKDSDVNVTGYNVYRSTNGGSSYTMIANAVSTPTYTDTPNPSLSCRVLWYRVEPLNCLGTQGAQSDAAHGDGTGLPDGTNATDAPTNGVTDTAITNNTPPAAPNSFQSKSGYRRNYLVWDNPGDADFDHTVVNYSTVTYPSTPTSGFPVENAPGGNGTFFGNTNQTMTFTHDRGTTPPSLNINTTYYYTVFAYDRCGNVTSAQASAQTAAQQCGDEPTGPAHGPPPAPTLANPAATNTCDISQGTIQWNLIDDRFPAGVYDLAGYNVYRADDNFAGPYIKQNASLIFGTYPAIRTYTDSTLVAGHTYYFKVRATDCDFEVNGGANGGGESLSTPVITVTPGALTPSPTNTNVLSQGNHHEKVIFWMKNTKANPPDITQGQIKLQTLNLTYSNPNARVARVTILNNLTDPSDDEVIYQDTTAPVWRGSGSSIPLSGSVVLNGQEDVPIEVDFLHSDATASDDLDMRNLTITAYWTYENVAYTLDHCSTPMALKVPLSPDAHDVVQNKPVSPTTASTTVGVNIVAPDDEVNVLVQVNDSANKGIAGVVLYWTTTDQTVTLPPPPGGSWTAVPMVSLGGDTWTLNNTPFPDTRIPAQNGMRVWYYIVATDNITNFDQEPPFDEGVFTYDQLN